MSRFGGSASAKPALLVLPVAAAVVLAAAGGAVNAASLPASPISWTLVGTGVAGDSGDGGQAREATINLPRSVAVTADGGVVWGEPWSNRVRKVWPDGHVSTVAGTGIAGYSGDGGPATEAELNFVHAASPTGDGGYLLADTMNCRIRAVSPAGIITTVAGDGSCGYAGDGGPATSAEINNPRSVTALPDGGFVFPDTNNHRVRRVWPDGTITTIAGTGVQGFSGDGGAATDAELSDPFGVSPTADGGFLIADIGNQRIREVAADGTITTVAGDGTAGFSGDGGPATSAELNNPHNVQALSDGSFLIADSSNNRIRLVSAAGVISTFEGDGTRGYTGEGGPASAAELSVPKGVAVTPAGDVVIADEQNNAIRFAGTIGGPANVSAPTLAGSPNQGMTLRASPGTWSGTGPTFAYQWERCDSGGGACADIGGATDRVYALTSADGGATIRVRVTATNPAGSASATSAPTSVVGAPLAAPANVDPPTVSGSASAGSTLTANPGTWSGTMPMTFSYQWRRCGAGGSACSDIAGATDSTYVPTGADVGSTLRVAVHASNAAGSSAYPAVVASDAPVSTWHLGDAGASVTDAHGFADGSAVGSPTHVTPGLVPGDGDGALTLDGTSQYVEIPRHTEWTTAPFSVELLVRPSIVPDNRTLAAEQTDSLNGWWLNTDSTGALRFFLGDGSAWRSAAAGPTLVPGETYDVVATYDGSVGRLYVNGSLASTGPAVSMAADVGTNPLRLGSASSFVGQFWPGAIDEVSFFDTALTPTQVSAHYGAIPSDPDAVSAPTGVVAPQTSSGGSGGGGSGGTPPPPTTTPAPPPTTPNPPPRIRPANLKAPAVLGVARVSRKLTATLGSWSGATPLHYAYRWQRCRRRCLSVGRNRSVYTLTGADVGARMRVVVTARNDVGVSAAASPRTRAVVRAAKPRRLARRR